MFNFKRFGGMHAVWAVLTVFSQSVFALGLGNISVESYLNQPLQARIALIVRADDDLSSATVGLASADDFALIGANREAISVPLRFDLDQDDSGAVILVTSEQAVKDPVIRLIVEVKWANGRLLREYTVFLDPPSFSAKAPSPVVDERGKTPVATAPESAEWVSSDTSGRSDSSAAKSGGTQTARVAAGSDEYGPVKSGDTLWAIAADWSRGTGLDMNTVMLAIQRNNPEAFIHGNVNLLKKGAILRLPQLDEVRQIGVNSAREEISQQNREFSQESVAPAVETPLLDVNAREPISAEADTGSSVQAKDQLELVPPADQEDIGSANGFEQSPDNATASTSVDELREELARKEEALIVEQQQNQYLQDQITELKDQLHASREGNIADTGLSEMEARLKDERLAGEGVKGEGPSAEATPDASAPAGQAKKAAVPQVTTSSPKEPEKAWYSRMTTWLLMLLVVIVALAGWLINRRGGGEPLVVGMPERKAETVREIKDEAEEILKVLKPKTEESSADKAAEVSAGEGEDAEKTLPRTPRVDRSDPMEEAELLDEDSADPEVRLDLARAYISMGDREAARVILDEVVEHGSEEQQSEAKKMLAEL